MQNKTLTPAQISVVQFLSDGLTADEIAAKRFRSAGTIRKHIEQARERIGARNIAHMVKLCLVRGLIHSVVLVVVIGATTGGPDQRRMRLTRSFSVASSGRVVRHEV